MSIVLPSNHLLVERLIFENHANSCHSGTQVVLSNLRQQFWILRGRKTVQRVINQSIPLRILGRASINFEELNTILYDSEAVINSRPLNYLSEDPDDLASLTSSMFLQDIQTVGVPDMDNIDSINLTKRLRYQQRLRNDLRNRYRDEYLSLLVHQDVNKAGSEEVRVGDVVLIGCDNKKRLDCPMGLVVEVLPGKDNSVRVVKVKTRMGESERPVKRLYTQKLNSDSKIYKSELFKNVKDNHSKFYYCNNQNDNVNLEIKTKCARKVIKPIQYDNVTLFILNLNLLM
ncbi:DUF5641 domain-containing protein [Trichonephila clavipes]|nr:DUF5641 domain-containing protein [Trichonephila clavipes]